jgi:hypothetical protein
MMPCSPKPRGDIGKYRKQSGKEQLNDQAHLKPTATRDMFAVGFSFLLNFWLFFIVKVAECDTIY